jgi:hypothetical protein
MFRSEVRLLFFIGMCGLLCQKMAFADATFKFTFDTEPLIGHSIVSSAEQFSGEQIRFESVSGPRDPNPAWMAHAPGSRRGRGPIQPLTNCPKGREYGNSRIRPQGEKMRFRASSKIETTGPRPGTWMCAALLLGSATVVAQPRCDPPPNPNPNPPLSCAPRNITTSPAGTVDVDAGQQLTLKVLDAHAPGAFDIRWCNGQGLLLRSFH